MRYHLLLAATAVLLPAACASSNEPDETEPQPVCTMEARSSFVVTVIDAVTGANLAPEATVRATDGTISETLDPVPDAGTYSGGLYERAGSFTIVVSHPEYDQWQQAGVVVERDECHVITESVTARLTPR